MSRHIVLVGLPGSGKTTIGKLVADRLGVSFFDVDPIIESEAGLSIRQIFSDHSEAAFRSLETRAVARLLTEPPAVLAPGGGWIAQPGNLETARAAHAFLVYLRCSPDAAVRRTEGDSNRPLLAGVDRVARLRELLAVRESFYLQADVIVDSEGKELAEVVEEIAQAIRLRHGGTEAQRHLGPN